MLGPVRARDVRSTIRERGFEQGVVELLERMAEERVKDRQNMQALIQMVDNCIDEITKFVSIGDKLRQEIAELQRLRSQGDNIDGSHQ